MSGSEAERGVRPETFLPPGLCFVPSAEVAARGPHPPEKGRCPPLRSVAPRCPTLCLLSQMPFPSVTAVSSSRWALIPCLRQDSLLTWTAPNCAGCWWSPSPVPVWLVCCWEAGRGAEQQAYQQGELLRFPSWSLGPNWGSLAFVEACSNSVSVTFPQPRPEAMLCSYLFLLWFAPEAVGPHMKWDPCDQRIGLGLSGCLVWNAASHQEGTGDLSQHPDGCLGNAGAKVDKRDNSRAPAELRKVLTCLWRKGDRLCCALTVWGCQSFISGHTPNRLLVFICICLKFVIHVSMYAFNDVTYNEDVSHWVMSNSLWPYGLSPTRLFCPWGFSRQEYCSGLPFPSPGDLPYPGMEPRSPALQADSLPTEPPGRPCNL